MSPLEEKCCDNCVNTRTVVSENGLHPVCSLSAKAAKNCLLGVKDRFVLKRRFVFVDEER